MNKKILKNIYKLYFAIHNTYPRFGPKLFRKKKIFCLNFLNQLFIYLYLDTCFLCYKGILASIFEHIIVQEILCNGELQNTRTGTTHV